MGLKLKVTSGPLAGREFDLKPGLIIGRANVDISIIDSKMSGKHAKIEKTPQDTWLLTDLGSRNGLYVGSERQPYAELSPGMSLRMGSTQFEVLSGSSGTTTASIVPNSEEVTLTKEPTGVPLASAIHDLPPQLPNSLKEPEIPATPAPPPPPQLTPFEYLADFTARALEKVKDKPTDLRAFKPLVVLTVTHGLQAGTEWVLGYGPRSVGPNSLDCAVVDTQAPGLAFSVLPDEENTANFITKFPDQVALNGRHVSSEKLNDGDIISFSATRIKVSFRE